MQQKAMDGCRRSLHGWLMFLMAPHADQECKGRRQSEEWKPLHLMTGLLSLSTGETFTHFCLGATWQCLLSSSSSSTKALMLPPPPNTPTLLLEPLIRFPKQIINHQ